MSIRVVIVEDELAGREFLQDNIERFCPDVEVLAVAESVVTAVESIKKLKPDVVLLDVALPDGTGMNVIELTMAIDYYVIFITAHDEYAIEAINSFDKRISYYILKPVSIKKLISALNKIQDQINAKEPSSTTNLISLSSGGEIVVFDKSQILCCDGDGAYSKVHFMDHKPILISKRLKECELILTPPNFIRIHQSHLVNVAHIKKYMKGRGGYVVLTDGSTKAVSSLKKDQLLKLLNRM